MTAHSSLARAGSSPFWRRNIGLALLVALVILAVCWLDEGLRP